MKLSKLIKISLLGAIGFLLMYLDFAIPIFPNFLKIDLGDIPALIGAFAFGPLAGVLIELLKNILHGLFKGGTAGVGELANFLVGAVYVFVAGYIYKYKKTKYNAVVSLVVATLIMTVTASILNYFVFLPLYETVLHFPIAKVVKMGAKINPGIKDLNTFIIFAILPFNLLKGILASTVTVAVYKSVSRVLHEEARKDSAVKVN